MLVSAFANKLRWFASLAHPFSSLQWRVSRSEEDKLTNIITNNLWIRLPNVMPCPLGAPPSSCKSPSNCPKLCFAFHFNFVKYCSALNVCCNLKELEEQIMHVRFGGLGGEKSIWKSDFKSFFRLFYKTVAVAGWKGREKRDMNQNSHEIFLHGWLVSL